MIVVAVRTFNNLIQKPDPQSEKSSHTYWYGTNDTPRFTKDEYRIANHFITDTLPGLLRHGLIKRYTRTESGTMIAVAGHIWEKRSAFFKQSLMAEVLTYEKVNGYALLAQVKDSVSGNLYAQISPEGKIDFYE
jgi:hypothetical protein